MFTRRDLTRLALGSMISAVTISRAFAQSTPTTDALAFVDNENFDDRLRARMSKGIDKIEVYFEPPVGSLPPRILNWLDAIRQYDGEIRVRDVSKGWLEDLLFGVAVMIFGALVELGKQLLTMMRNPARDYHVIVVTEGDPSSQDEINFLRLVFVNKSNTTLWASERENTVPWNAGETR